MSVSPTLVVLAAGLGSRYGGLKQFDPLGPGGATLMDYSVYDAWRAGFARVVFVIRPGMAVDADRMLGDRYRSRLQVVTAEQRLTDLPPGFAPDPARSRPWGTTQAVLAARTHLDGPFAVLNADDFYGRAALDTVAAYLAEVSPEASEQAVVGYRLAATASPAGGVNRGLLEPDLEGHLIGIRELRDLLPNAQGDFEAGSGSGAVRVAADALVSMNLWGFLPTVLPVLQHQFERFMGSSPGERDESFLPEAIQGGVADGAITVRVLPTTSRWCGVTYAADRDWVGAELRRLVDQGAYPEMLWP